MATTSLPRVSLAPLPTPIQELQSLRNTLGGASKCPRILVKRDDLTGIATGGNKVRKLEFLLGAAKSAGADTVIATGFGQSNFCRQTAAAAAKLGLRCILALGGERPAGTQTGNILLMEICGAELRWIGTNGRDEMCAKFAEEVKKAGGNPYVIPTGGSTAVGACGYVVAVEEAVAQLGAEKETINHVVFTSGSGGTHAGMLVGAAATGWTKPNFEAVTQSAKLVTEVKKIATETAELLQVPQSSLRQVKTNYFPLWEKHAFGEVTDYEREALKMLAGAEGIISDPLYTACSVARVIQMCTDGSVAPHETILWWHTGGQAGLFPQASKL